MGTQKKAGRADAVANRQRILSAAREVFAQKGLAAEVLEVAAKAGVGSGTLYRHFKNREGLVDALITECAWELLKDITPETETMEPGAAFREVLHMAAKWCERLGMFAEDVISGRAGKREDRFVYAEDFTRKISALLENGVEQGVFRKDMDIPLIITLAASLFSWRSAFDIPKQRSFIEAADAIADFLLTKMIDRPQEQAIARNARDTLKVSPLT